MKNHGILRSALAAALFAAGAAEARTIVTNTIDVTAFGGSVPSPVQLHQDDFRAWLNDPDFTNTWKTVYGAGTNNLDVQDFSYSRDLPLVIRITDGERVQDFVNCYPGTEYAWDLGNGLSGTFTTEDQMPRTFITPNIRTDKMNYGNNFRDLGGWPLINGNGRRTKFNVFYRSACWDGWSNKTNCPMYDVFGIRAEIDLRTARDATNVEQRVKYYHRPLDDGKWAHPYLEEDKAKADMIATIFGDLGDTSNRPLLFHCQVGKDRTGYIAFLIESLCGVEEDALYKDFLATTFSGAGVPEVLGDNQDNMTYLTKRLRKKGEDANKTQYNAYGDSLAGRARCYLEMCGASSNELDAVTMSLVGEHLDQVLARVDPEHYTADPVDPGEEDPEVPGEDDPSGGEAWTTFGNLKYDFRKSSDGVLNVETNWTAGNASSYAIFRVYDKKADDTAKDLSLTANWTVPEFDFGYASGCPYTGALTLGDYTLACSKAFNVMTGNVARVTSGTVRIDDISATAHVGWNSNSAALGGNASLILDGPDAGFVSMSTNALQIGCYPGPGCRVEVLNGATFESPLELGHAREKGGTWGNVFLASGAKTVVNVSSNSTYIGAFGWDEGVRTWGNSLILTDGAKMIAKTIYIGGGNAQESSNNVFEVSNGATLEMTGKNRIVSIGRNGCEGNMMKIMNTTLNAEKGHGNFEIYLEPNHNGTLYLAGTNTSVLLGRTQSFPATTKLVIDVSGPQVGDKAMMTAVNYEFDSASTLYITSSADLAGVGPFEVKVLADYGDAMNAIPDGVIKIDPAFEGRFVIDTTTDPKSLIVRYTGGEPAPEEAGWEDAEKAGDTATAADVWGAAVPADLAGVNAKRLAAWATAKEVAFASAATIKSEAFLLNCANTDAAVEKAKDEFRFTSIKPGEVPEIDGDFNGTVVIKGSTDLKTWNEKASASDSFYKAVLEK